MRALEGKTMRLKLHGNNLLCIDLKSNIKIAEVNEELNSIDKKYLVLNNNFGQEFIEKYEHYRMNMHIANMTEMIEKMEKLYAKYNYEKMKIRRKNG